MFFKHTKINEKLVPCRRVQFTVSVDGDSTRWKLPKHHIPGNKKIRHKYYAEFAVALKNLIIKKGFFSSLSDAFIWKAKINSILMRILMKINRVKFFLLIKKLNTKN